LDKVITEILFEKFEVIECLKKDISTAVYIANHIFLGKKIILKTLNIDEIPDKTVLERFKREARILAHLNHPNLIKVLDFGTFKNYFYLSFEYFESRSLRAIIKYNDLSVNEKKYLLIQLLKALDVAHQNRVIHRDIKPENILVNSNLELKIADFGLAMILNETTLTQKASIVGTPSYMSPEQIRGEELTPQTDLFSVGIIAYELFMDENPFVGDDVSKTINNILNFDESSIFNKINNLPEDIQSIIKMMLRKSYKNRARSAAVILNILGIKEEVQYKISKEIERKRVRSILFLLIPILLIAMVFTYYFTSSNVRDIKNPLNPPQKFQTPLIVKHSEILKETNTSSKMPAKPNNIDAPVISKGKIFIECLPWADVYIDDKKVDQTPLKGAIALTAGYHTIKLIHPDYPPYTERIKVSADKIDSVSVNFNNLVGSIDFNVNPWGYVYVNDTLKGTTPLKEPLVLLPGRYKITIANPTFGKIDTTVILTSKSKLGIYHNFLSSNSVF
jgi:eukaryotic-like serine/threonine-protein kinase